MLMTRAPATAGVEDSLIDAAARMADRNDAFVVRQDAPFAEVVRVFTDQRVGAVPVVDEADHLVGIISYVDVFKNAGAL